MYSDHARSASVRGAFLSSTGSSSIGGEVKLGTRGVNRVATSPRVARSATTSIAGGNDVSDAAANSTVMPRPTSTSTKRRTRGTSPGVRNARRTVEKLSDGKPNKANYGFAWEINNVNGHRVIEHGGAWQGFTTYIARYVDDRLTVVALTNLDSGHSNPKKITSGVAAIYNPALKPPEEKPIEDKEPHVTQMLRDVLRETADGKAKQERFTEELQKRLFPDELQELGPALKEFGELKGLELMERSEEGERRNYRYRAKYPNLTLMISIGLTKDDKIAKLNFSEE